MAHIEISNLDAADSNSSASADGFLTELEKTDTLQIFGGRSSRISRSCWTPPVCPPKPPACKPSPAPVVIIPIPRPAPGPRPLPGPRPV